MYSNMLPPLFYKPFFGSGGRQKNTAPIRAAQV